MRIDATPGSMAATSIIEHARALDLLEAKRFATMGMGKGVMPNVPASVARDMAERIMTSAAAAGKSHKMGVAFSLTDSSQLGITFRRGGLKETFNIPLISGFTTSYPSKNKGVPGRLSAYRGPKLGQEFAQPGFVVPSYIVTGHGETKSMSLGQMVTEQFESSMRGLEFGSEGKGLRAARKSVFGLYKNAVWTTSKNLATPPIKLDTPAAILQATKFQVLQSTGGAPSTWVPLGEMMEKKQALGPGGINFSNLTSQMADLGQEYEKRGITQKGLNWLALKPEAGINSFVTQMTLGHLTPFGRYADPVRQAHQTWAMRPLLGGDVFTPKGYVSGKDFLYRPVTTRAYEGAVSGVGRHPFYAALQTLFTDDPRLEAAAGLSEGGALLTHSGAAKLQYLSPKGSKRTPGLGSALEVGRLKVTVGAMLKETTGGIEAIVASGGRSKHGDMIKTQIIESVLGSLGEIHEVTTPHKLRFLKDIAEVVGGDAQLYRGHKPSISLTEKASMGTSELGRIRELIKTYNQGGYGKIEAGATIPEFIQRTTHNLVGAGGVVSSVTGESIITSVGVRDKAELTGRDATQWVVGYRGKRDRAQISGKGSRNRVHVDYSRTKRGMKASMRNLMNLRHYGNPESDAVANIFMQAMAGYRVQEKKEIWKGLMPLIGTHRVAGGIKAEHLGGLNIREVERGKAFYTSDDLAGTLLDPTRTQGVTVDLHKPFITRGAKNTDVAITQLHFPTSSALGLKEHRLPSGESVYSLNPLFWKEERAFHALTRGETGPSIQNWLDAFGEAVTGKDRRLSKLSQPRLGSSASLRAMPAGTGPAAEALGTALQPVTLRSGETIAAQQVVKLHPDDVRALGPAATRIAEKDWSFKPKGYLWLHLQRDPNQGASSNSAVLGRVMSEAEAQLGGRGAIRLSQEMSLLQRGDTDKDIHSILLLRGKSGQRTTARHGMVNTRADIAGAIAYAEQYNTPAQKAAYAATGAIPKTTYEEFLNHAKDMVSWEQRIQTASAQDQIYAMFGTKKATGMIDYVLQSQRNILSVSTEKQGRAIGSALLNELGQATGIVKAKDEMAMLGQRIMHTMFMSPIDQLKNQADRQRLTSEVADMITQMWGMIKQNPTKRLPGGLPAVFGGKSAEEITNSIKVGAGVLMDLGAGFKEGMGGIRSGMLQAVEGKSHSIDNLIAGAMSYIEAAATGSTSNVDSITMQVARASGLDVALADTNSFVAEMTHAAMKGGTLEQTIANQSIKAEGAAAQQLPTPLIDTVVNWFKNPKTPALHKAGVLTGTALLGGAIVKNMLFPGYHPADDVEPMHVAVPVPLRMPGYDMSAASIFDDVPSSRTPVDSQFSMPLQYGNMGFRARPPAVQMGAGTLEPGVMPFLTGSMAKESPQAPMVLNHASYQNQATNPVPQTVRVGSPRESSARSYLPTQGSAEIRGNLPRELLNSMPSGSVRFEGYNDRSDREMMSMLEQQEMSNFT